MWRAVTPPRQHFQQCHFHVLFLVAKPLRGPPRPPLDALSLLQHRERAAAVRRRKLPALFLAREHVSAVLGKFSVAVIFEAASFLLT